MFHVIRFTVTDRIGMLVYKAAVSYFLNTRHENARYLWRNTYSIPR